MTHPALDLYLDWVKPFKGSSRLHTWAWISCLSAMLERRCWLPVVGNKSLYPNMYVVLVAGAGVGKSVPLDIAKQRIVDYNISLGPTNGGIKFAPDVVTPAALIKEFKSAHRTIKGVPIRGQIEQSALFGVNSEFGVFYQDIGGGELVIDLLNFYDCPAHFYKKLIGDGDIKVKGLTFSMLSAATPSYLSSNVSHGAAGNGFISRVLFIGEYDKVEFDPEPAMGDRQLELKVQNELARLHRLRGQFKYSAGGKQRWHEIFYEVQKEVQDLPEGSFRRNFYARKNDYIRKISMVMSAARGNSLLIDTCDVNRAYAILEEAEPYMEKSFGLQDLKKMGGGYSEILALIPETEEITEGDLKQALIQNGIAAYNTDFKNALDFLIDANQIKFEMRHNQLFLRRA